MQPLSLPRGWITRFGVEYLVSLSNVGPKPESNRSAANSEHVALTDERTGGVARKQLTHHPATM